MTPQYYISLEATGDQALAQEAVKRQQKIYGQYDKTVEMIKSGSKTYPYRIILKGFESEEAARAFRKSHTFRPDCLIYDAKTDKAVSGQ
jgi:SPOR domain